MDKYYEPSERITALYNPIHSTFSMECYIILYMVLPQDCHHFLWQLVPSDAIPHLQVHYYKYCIIILPRYLALS